MAMFAGIPGNASEGRFKYFSPQALSAHRQSRAVAAAATSSQDDEVSSPPLFSDQGGISTGIPLIISTEPTPIDKTETVDLGLTEPITTTPEPAPGDSNSYVITDPGYRDPISSPISDPNAKPVRRTKDLAGI